VVVAAGVVAATVVVRVFATGVVDARVELLELPEEPQPASASAIATVIGRARLTDRTSLSSPRSSNPSPYKRIRPRYPERSLKRD
jgi:hypothetical protein